MNYELRYVGDKFQIVNATVPVSKAEQIRALLREPLSYRQIAARVGANYQYTAIVANRAGVKGVKRKRELGIVGTAHKKNTELESRILKLVAQGISLRQIGVQVGRTGERVRQIVARNGLNGTELRKKRKTDQATSACCANPLFERFTQALLERGITWSPSFAGSDGHPLLSRLIVHGKTVQIGTAVVQSDGYIRLRPSRKSLADVHAIYIPDHGWLIFPQSAMPANATMFSLSPGKVGGAHRFRHDYASYLNKWEIFTEVKQ